jgi:SH3-like domain-containing protein
MSDRRNVFVRFAALVIALAAAPAAALEFRCVGDSPAVLYDGPTTRSNKVYVVSRGYPLEVVVAVEGWIKVRDANGAFSWIEAKQLGEKRSVLVKAPVADVRTKPEDGAPIAFRAEQNVLLDFVAMSGSWVQVRNRDGGVGYVKVQQVWGA